MIRWMYLKGVTAPYGWVSGWAAPDGFECLILCSITPLWHLLTNSSSESWKSQKSQKSHSHDLGILCAIPSYSALMDCTALRQHQALTLFPISVTSHNTHGTLLTNPSQSRVTAITPVTSTRVPRFLELWFHAWTQMSSNPDLVPCITSFITPVKNGFSDLTKS